MGGCVCVCVCVCVWLALAFVPCLSVLFRYTEPPTQPGGFVGRGIPEDSSDEGAGVRVDAGVREGSCISMFYDPMICKLVSRRCCCCCCLVVVWLLLLFGCYLLFVLRVW